MGKLKQALMSYTEDDMGPPDEAIVAAIKLLEANGYDIQLKLPEVNDA